MSKFWSTSIIVLTVTIFSFAVHGNSYVNKIRKEAESGDAEAQFALGARYYFGKGVKKDYAEAFSWFSKAAEKEHIKAEYNLGICFYYGKGVEKNFVKAVSWYKKAAEKGFPDAQYNLGKCLIEGTGIEKNFSMAEHWLLKAAENGFSKAQYILGNIYYWCKFDTTRGVYWYKKAAEKGLADAQFQLGKCYAIGIGVPQDEWEAKKWISKAASKEHVEAKAIIFSFNSFDTKQGRREKIMEWTREYRHMSSCCYRHSYCPVKNVHSCSIHRTVHPYRERMEKKYQKRKKIRRM